ncbi:hypothetical protein HPP92_011751 [Vanilla planifolia]|uniref:Uncharacterized protein n=1 Tax=Vanilla planifolia TaxID=51239 RepID=A0A835V116_VANPL|nr:hypothetical protein HPP92_011751 [Vanilla planifolia]
MDLETENRLAALLMEEARRLRREADKEGVLAYLRKSNVRGRPNSRFLTATVRGVEQANRAVQISEMWRAREKEKELDARQRPVSKAKNSSIHVGTSYSKEKARARLEQGSAVPGSLNKVVESRGYPSRHGIDERDNSPPSCDAALRDDEIEEFLQSRVKRGRGSVGCRMDEPGPYLSAKSSDQNGWVLSLDKRSVEEAKRRPLGPEKPFFLRCDAEVLANNEHKPEKNFSGKSLEESRKNKKPKVHHRQKKRGSRSR